MPIGNCLLACVSTLNSAMLSSTAGHYHHHHHHVHPVYITSPSGEKSMPVMCLSDVVDTRTTCFLANILVSMISMYDYCVNDATCGTYGMLCSTQQINRRRRCKFKFSHCTLYLLFIIVCHHHVRTNGC